MDTAHFFSSKTFNNQLSKSASQINQLDKGSLLFESELFNSLNFNIETTCWFDAKKQKYLFSVCLYLSQLY